ncbi:hypothetical protein [Roseovarius sp. THAF9]|uniref:hypothetical protein n=1 Tax=Roseovarius sp. THAF9 TaxID=2587847 RepID=UPI0012696DDB|nr:hypothetical protein [Roseovarius sp. THAF9]
MAASVVEDEPSLYWLAAACFLTAAVWAILSWASSKIRANAEAARRATLVMTGLGTKLSSHELSAVREACWSSERRAAAKAEDGYFASTAGPGPLRLAENIMESAFWTKDTLKWSGHIRLALLVVLALTAVATVAVHVRGDDPSALSAIMKAAFVFFAGLISAEGVSAIYDYYSASLRLGSIMERLETAKASGLPDPDLANILSDYNSTVESGPMPLPWVYGVRKRNISAAWAKRTDQIGGGA